jgi:hypothetical protein
MSVWLAFGMIIGVLAIVAIAILITDVARGDVGGGRHTMARAERLLIVADEPGLLAGAETWISEQRTENPQRQIFVLEDPEGESLPEAVDRALERYKPDGIVVARSYRDDPGSLGGIYGALKEDSVVPVDAIYVTAEATS